MGQRRLFEWMRQRGYLMRANGSSHNMPTQRSMERGWFEIKETSITHSDGHITVQRTPKVTGKGQQYFINLFLNGAAYAQRLREISYEQADKQPGNGQPCGR